jgi:hypothetical protein
MASYSPRGAEGEFSFGLIGFAAQTGEGQRLHRLPGPQSRGRSV